jgi:MarR family transcriptional regulator, organic hydroperoxide resistance regulator
MTDKELLDMFAGMVRALASYMNRRLSVVNLSDGQGGVILALGQHGSMSQKDLACFRQVTPATISIMLDRMERDGFVVRGSPKGKSRENSIRLTDTGNEIYERLDELMEDEPYVVFGGFTETEKEDIAVIFKRITDNIM